MNLENFQAKDDLAVFSQKEEETASEEHPIQVRKSICKTMICEG